MYSPSLEEMRSLTTPLGCADIPGRVAGNPVFTAPIRARAEASETLARMKAAMGITWGS